MRNEQTARRLAQTVRGEVSSVQEVPETSVGSVWRRWDPHVHLPGTLFNDQFGAMSVADALNALASREPAIEAVGVTDYFTTAGYRSAVEAWEAGAGTSIGFLFPNVELRLNVPTRAGSGVNLHLLCAPQHVDWLDGFLAGLSFTWQDRTFRADLRGLEELGRAFREDSSLPAEAARREGAKQFKVDFNELRELYLKDRTAVEHCLVAVAAGQGDGTSGVRTEDGSFAAHRQAMERFAHIVFSGSDAQRQFWLGHGVDSEERIHEVYGGPKPCLHGSDAHAPDTLGIPDADRYCWLKGDPCFDTLRFAALAPGTRAAVSAVSPGAGEEHGRITGVSIEQVPWFPQESIAVNTGLVAIIGARGSGKTALADLIAVGAGSAEPFENKASFVYRARTLLDGESVVHWHGGDSSRADLGDWEIWEGPEVRVRYLSQQFVERLCASDGVSDELLTEIDRVIYNSWPVDERQGAVDFRDLLDIRLSSARDRQLAELEAVGALSDEIIEQRVLTNSLPRKREALARLQQTADTIRAQIGELTKRSGSANAERHGIVSQALASAQETLQAVDRQRTELRALSEAVKSATAVQFPRFVESLRARHQHAGLSSEQWTSFVPEFSGDVASVLATASADAEKAYRATMGEPLDAEVAISLDGLTAEELVSRTVSELKAEQARLQALVGLDSARAAQLTRLQKLASETQGKVSKLEVEIADAEGADGRRVRLTTERTARYESYFNAILEEEQELKRLYRPLREILERFGTSAAKLRLAVRRRVDVNAWAAAGEALLDLRTAGAFHGTGELARIARETLVEAWETGDGNEAASAVSQFSERYSEDLRTQSRVPRNDERAYREWEQGVARWLYGVDHIRLVYSLEYEGLDVQRLSPGTRGIVLLLLYLAVDESETDPLIIDQPEENLDPESVYTELVSLFRSASSRRQIIMVTHNANLVVNTDVDQVLVARPGPLAEGQLPHLMYLAGGLERREVRAAVCDVLEGGAEAFRQRARRLRIDVPGTSTTRS